MGGGADRSSEEAANHCGAKGQQNNLERKGETMSIHCDDKTWLTKLERIGKLANQEPSIVFNNLMHIIDSDLLQKQYYKLQGNKALGIDGISKYEYGKDLSANIDKLISRIRNDKYRPKPARIVMIPKEDGSSRPLAISCFEDKLVQAAVYEILSIIYEPIFLQSSYGFRPNKNAHEALRELHKLTYSFKNGAIVEIDIRKYFNTIPHKALRELMCQKITDKKFLRLLKRIIETPIIESSTIVQNKDGCPAGSIVSPILANIYLHYVIDLWFENTKKYHLEGKAGMVRYADDMVFIFEYEKDAERFYRSLPKRLNKYGLTMHEDKSQLLKSGRNHAQKAHKEGKRLPTYNFLGFTCYWGKSRNATIWRLKLTSRRDRFTAKLCGLRKYLQENLASKDKVNVLLTVVRVIRGWINYHAVSDNQRRVSSFIHHSKNIIFKWYNRMGGKKRLNWENCAQILKSIKFPVMYKVASMFPLTK